MVPVLIPKDTQKALGLLADKRIRKDVCVSSKNKYLFPSTQGSECHASGWHIIHNLCKKLELSSSGNITATRQRHRVSTLFASLDLPQSERNAFFAHMGHSEDINVNVYQAPPAITEIIKVGKHLTKMDTGIVITIWKNDENECDKCLFSTRHYQLSTVNDRVSPWAYL